MNDVPSTNWQVATHHTPFLETSGGSGLLASVFLAWVLMTIICAVAYPARKRHRSE